MTILGTFNGIFFLIITFSKDGTKNARVGFSLAITSQEIIAASAVEANWNAFVFVTRVPPLLISQNGYPPLQKKGLLLYKISFSLSVGYVLEE